MICVLVALHASTNSVAEFLADLVAAVIIEIDKKSFVVAHIKSAGGGTDTQRMLDVSLCVIIIHIGGSTAMHAVAHD